MDLFGSRVDPFPAAPFWSHRYRLYQKQCWKRHIRGERSSTLVSGQGMLFWFSRANEAGCGWYNTGRERNRFGCPPTLVRSEGCGWYGSPLLCGSLQLLNNTHLAWYSAPSRDSPSRDETKVCGTRLQPPETHLQKRLNSVCSTNSDNCGRCYTPRRPPVDRSMNTLVQHLNMPIK